MTDPVSSLKLFNIDVDDATCLLEALSKKVLIVFEMSFCLRRNCLWLFVLFIFVLFCR